MFMTIFPLANVATTSELDAARKTLHTIAEFDAHVWPA